MLLCITLFERLRHFTRTGNYAERIQRALPKRVQEVSIFMSGAHADIEAVFDYAPDAKLLAADARADDWNDDDASHGGAASGTRRESARQYVNDSESDIEASDSEEDADESGSREPPVIAHDAISQQQPQPAGILSSSPEQTRALPTQITFNSPNRRRSSVGAGNVPPPRRRDSPSVLQKLYGPGGTTQESTATRGMSWDPTPPSWVLELNATLRGIEERQRHLEQILGGAKDPDSASMTSAGNADT